MDNRLRMVSVVALLVTSVSAMAAGKLTSMQCHSYPFVKTKGEVTHRDLMRELSELESVGYQPGVSDSEYPRDVTRAEKLLQAKYAADCAGATQSAGASNAGTGGAS